MMCHAKTCQKKARLYLRKDKIDFRVKNTTKDKKQIFYYNKRRLLYITYYVHMWASLVAQPVENLPATGGWVQPLGWEDPMKKGMAIHCSILPWRIPWTEDPGGLLSMGLQRVGQD